MNHQIFTELKEYVGIFLDDLPDSIPVDRELHHSLEDRMFSKSTISSPIEGDTRLESWVSEHKKPPFNRVLMELIDDKGYMKDSDVYRKAGVDRRLFSKIRTSDTHIPRRETVIALALALELDLSETNRLLSAAGYNLSENSTFDLVIRFSIERRIFNLLEVNELLRFMDQKLLLQPLE